MKKLWTRFSRISLLLVSSVLLAFSYPTISMAANQEIKIIINGRTQQLQMSPTILDGSVLVPMREIFEGLGAVVKWDNSTKQIIATKDFSEIILTIGSKSAKINNSTVSLNTSAKTINGNTFVPLRFVSEALNAEVKWDKDMNTVNVFLKSKWERVDLSDIKSTTQFGTSYIMDWSPDNILTAAASTSGIVQYINGKWVQMDSENSPVKSMKINNLRWSQDGNLAVIARDGDFGINHIWIYSKDGGWKKTNLPQVTVQMGKPSKDFTMGPKSNDFIYMDWSNKNVLTASFGIRSAGADFTGLWQLKGDNWIELFNKNNTDIGSIEDIAYLNEDIYFIDHLNEVYLFQNNIVSKLSSDEAEDDIEKFFIQDGRLFGIGGGNQGILEFENKKFTSWNKQPSDIRQAWLEEVAYSNNQVVISSPNNKNLLWLLKDGFWAKLADNSAPFVYKEENLKIPEGYKLARGVGAADVTFSPDGRKLSVITAQDVSSGIGVMPYRQYLWVYSLN